MKIGSQLFTAEGPGIVRDFAAQGHRVFLDLKFHDIPNTVAGPCDRPCGTRRVDADGPRVRRRGRCCARRATRRRTRPRKRGTPRPLIVAVTVLTSLDAAALASVGVTRPLAAQVEALARLARDAGMDGVVASPHEVAAIRARVGRDFLDRDAGHPPGAADGRAGADATTRRAR